MLTSNYFSHSDKDTFDIGVSFGKQCSGNEVFLLSGALGSGKTIFTKGMAKGLNIMDLIVSPTFSIVNEYKGKFDFFHFDLYRLNNCSELFDIGFDEYRHANSVCVLEWGDKCKDYITPPFVIISFESVSISERKIMVKKYD